MEAYANLAVVMLVILVSVLLLVMLLNNQPHSSPSESKIDFVTQLLFVWILAWTAWGVCWGFKAFSSPVQFTAANISNATQLLSNLTNRTSAANFVWRKISTGTNDSLLMPGTSESQISTDLALRLNKLVTAGPLFDVSLFTNLSKSTLGDLGKTLDPTGLVTFNRKLVSELVGGQNVISVTPPKPKWQQYVWIALSSMNAVFFFLIIIIILRGDALKWILVWTYAAIMIRAIAAYYLLMMLVAGYGTPGFDGLIVNWSIAESVVAPLLLTIAVWKLSDCIFPLFFGIVYAFAQPIVYQADLDISSLSFANYRDAIIVTLAFLKVLLAASVLYALGVYAGPRIKEATFRIHTALRNRIRYTIWNAAVSALILGGILIWYFMAGQAPSGLQKGITSLVAFVGIAINILNLKNGTTNSDP